MEMLTSDNHRQQAPTRSQPSSQQDTHCCDRVKVLLLPHASLGQPAASSSRCSRLNTRSQVCLPLCSPPSASPTAAEGTEDVGLNPSGTGTRSPGFTYQNTASSDKSQQQQLPGEAEHWLLFGQCSQEETHSCISRRGRSISTCVYNCLPVPYFLHLLRALMLNYSSSR